MRGTAVVLSRGGVVASLRVGVVSGSFCIRHLHGDNKSTRAVQ